jgi:hypothetical protein
VVTDAATWAARSLAGVPPDAWQLPGTTVSWTPRQTLDHIIDSLFLHAAYVARRAATRISPPRNGDPSAGPEHLRDVLTSAAAVHAHLLEELPTGVRVFHPSGLADAEGWIGMACTEVLVHTYDVAAATGIRLEPPVRLAAAVVARVLPWAYGREDGWARLLWATGRAPLGDRPPAPADWWWQSAPLAQWDGRPRRRTVPPAW